MYEFLFMYVLYNVLCLKFIFYKSIFIVRLLVCSCGPKLGAVPSLGAPGGHRRSSPLAATSPSQHHCPEPLCSLYNVANIEIVCEIKII